MPRITNGFFRNKMQWLGSHSNLVSSDAFTEDAWRASQNKWPEAYWDVRACLRYRKEHKDVHKYPYNLSTLTRVVALYIILLAAMFIVLCVGMVLSSGFVARISSFVVPYFFIAAGITWVVYLAYRHKVDYYWRLYSRRLFIYEKNWPGIKAMAKKDSDDGITETPPPLTRRDQI